MNKLEKLIVKERRGKQPEIALTPFDHGQTSVSQINCIKRRERCLGLSVREEAIIVLLLIDCQLELQQTTREPMLFCRR